MSANTPSVHEDLAFLKALVEPGAAHRHQVVFGKVYLVAGLLYGFHSLIYYLAAKGWIALSPLLDLALVLGVNLGFIGYLAWVIWTNRKLAAGSMATRAINAVFSAVGIANIALAAIFLLAVRAFDNPLIWLLHPAVVFVLQGGAWFTAFTLRRRLWLGVVAFGWMGTGVALIPTIGRIEFPLIVAAGLLAWMALPGAVTLRLARKDA